MSESKKTKNKTKIFLLTALLSTLIFAVTACSLFYALFLRDDVHRVSVTVPELEGKFLFEVTLPESFYLEKDYIFSSEVDEGIIISQYPSSGSGRKVEHDGGSLKIQVTVSAGGKRSQIPELRGYEARQAKILLEEIGCAVRTVRIYSPSEESGAVLSSSPEAGREVKAGDVVTLFVSRADFHDSVRVPDVCGLDRSEACRLILSMGLCVGNISEDESTVSAENSILSQYPEEGMLVRWGSRINITVAKLPEGDMLETEDINETERKVPWFLPERGKDKEEWSRSREE